MLAVFLLVGSAFALDGLPVPEPVPGECTRSIPIQKGVLVSSALIDENGSAKCSGVLEPASSFAYLLAVETEAETREKIHALDVSILQTERDYYKTALQNERAREWWKQPDAQRWFGRLEMLATVGIVAGGIGAAYNFGKGG